MENNVLQKRWVQGSNVVVDDLRGTMFTGEIGAHTFLVSGVGSAQETVPITGTITGRFLAANNVSIPLEGSVADGVASLTLTEDCYIIPGRFVLSIYATNGGVKQCIYCGVGNVFRTQSDIIEYPSASIPDIEQIIADAQAAVTEINADVAAAQAAVAAAQTAVDGIEDQRQTMIASIASVAGQGTDTTLTQSGVAADAKATGDEVSALKSAFGDFIYKNKPIAGYKYIHMPVMNATSAGTTIFAKALNVTSDIESIWLTGKYNSSTQDLINLTDGQEHIYTTLLNFTDVTITVTLSGDNRTDGNTTYEAICMTNAKNDTMASILLENQTDILSLNNRLDSPFETDINSKFKGIIGFQFLYDALDTGYEPNGNQQYRITNIYYKDSFYLYISMQRYKNGAWSAFDNLTIAMANAPTETALMVLTSNYKRFKMAFIPGLMTAGRATNVEYMIKNTFVNPFVTELQNQINEYVPYDSYMLKDVTRHIVTVKKDGTGDYTTIGAAFSAISSGKLSSFFDQYEIVVYPGIYNEVNLICPRYTHTHGFLPNTVIVTSEGMTGTQPVFDQTGGPSKLSNMEIRSQTGYCIHIDNPLIHAVVNENLHCKKIYSQPMPDFAWVNTSQHRVIIGMGAQPSGMNVVFNGCWFEDGAVVCHSNSSANEDANFHIIYNHCVLTNSYIQFNMAGNEGAANAGNWVGEINGLVAPRGYAGIVLRYGEAVTGLDYNFGWQIIGGGNDVAIKLDKVSDTSAPDCWDQVNVTEKMIVQAKAAITKGQLVTDGWIPATAEEKNHNIIGIALEDASSGNDCQVWAGNAFVFTGTDGEYGVGADGTLSAGATEKIGKIINNVFYRY